MPRKAKDKEEVIENNKKTEKKPSSTGTTETKTAAKKTATTSKKTTTKKTTSAKKETTKTAARKTSKSSKTTSTKKSGTTAKKSTTAKKTTTKKAETTAKTKKTETKKEVAAKKTTPKKVVKNEEKVKEETVIQKIKAFIAKIAAMQEEAKFEEENKKLDKKETKKSAVQTSYMLEYYDLPYRYNETVVKILAQTPKRLFVYWDISDEDRKKYLLAFGERFFEETYPVLLVHNEDMNYTFEVPINDFANSWYLDIKDSKSKYTIQLGRKFRKKPEMVNIVASTETENVVLHNDYVPIITSNILEVPNDRILFENVQSKVIYRNVKNGKESTVEIDNLEFAKKMGHIYSIYDVYKEIYKHEMDNDSLTSLLNPSSMSSSVFR